MDIPWTDPSTIPEKLYRVICPNQNTYYDPKNGLIAAMTLPSECWISGTDLPLFHHSIRCHREQEKIPSPYISLFEDLSEAEIYCIAASDFHQDINGDKCFIIEIDTIHHNMRSIRPWLWFVHDIQVMCPKGVQLGEGPEDNLAAESQKGGRFDSEWLCLYAVPGVKGMKILKGSKQCRIDQDWEGGNEFAITGPPKLKGGINNLEEWLGREPIIRIWEQCNLCAGAEDCQHGGGFDRLMPGTPLSQGIRDDVPVKLAKVLNKPAKSMQEASAARKRTADVAAEGEKLGKSGGGPNYVRKSSRKANKKQVEDADAEMENGN